MFSHNLKIKSGQEKDFVWTVHSEDAPKLIWGTGETVSQCKVLSEEPPEKSVHDSNKHVKRITGQLYFS